MTDLETRLGNALADTARRNLTDNEVPPTFYPAGSEATVAPRARWLVPVLAAAVVVSLAVGVLIGADRLHRSSPTPPAGATASTTVVTLAAPHEARLSPAQLQLARQNIAARVTALGFDHATVQAAGSNQLVVTLPGVSLNAGTLSELHALGAPDALQFRPLIIEPISAKAAPPVTSTEQRVVDPWRSLGFSPPKDAGEFAALSPARQQAVRAVLNGWDCRNLPLNTADSPTVMCDPTTVGKYLLGPAVVGSDDFAAATATPPSAQHPGWAVNLDLKPAAQQRWIDYTSQHNVTRTPNSTENEVADVLDGKVINASTIQETITGTTQVTGIFDQPATEALAASLPRGPLPAPFDVLSIHTQ
ncbi:MAG: hypothetical protein M3Y42_03040 [Actinomycetota bacterium]|nr:hypothetical protein [Actinomycetota bacterium]MDQ2955923.1 hypothetical protein [Actinomycetota bacterium]